MFYWTGTPSTRLMSVDMPADDALRPGPPKLMFQSLSSTTWDVTPDRGRFLIEVTASRDGAQGRVGSMLAAGPFSNARGSSL